MKPSAPLTPVLVALLVLAACQRQAVAPAAERETAALVPTAASAASPPAAVPAPAPAPASAAASGPIVPPMVAVVPPSDAERAAGATLASQGGGQAIPACATCHGAQGEGNAQAGYPRLAGQSATYLQQQLQSYAEGSRENAVMGPIAKALSEPQRRAGAAYYASLPPAGPAGNAAAASGAAGSGTAKAAGAAAPAATGRAAPRTASAHAASARGRQLATLGDESRMLQGCVNCHGPDGIGSGVIYPYLAGQPASYLRAALAAWRNGSRHNDPASQMPFIAKAMAESDLEAVASYYASLPPPLRPLDAPPTALARAVGAAALVSGPRQAGAQGSAPQGVGSEQGAPLTGGAQGPGGGGTGTGATGSQPGRPASAAAPLPGASASAASGAAR